MLRQQIEVELEVETYESDKVIENGTVNIGHCDGYLVPGGFGERGWMGKILAANTAEKIRSLLWPLLVCRSLCRIRPPCPQS